MDTMTAQIQTGWDVITTDGEKIGGVEEVGAGSLHVTKGIIFPSDLYVPNSAIASVEDGAVYLNVAQGDIDGLGWDQPTDEAVYADNDQMVASQTTDYAAPTDFAQSDTEAVVDEPLQTHDTDSIRVQRYEEDLQAQKQAVDAGEVTIRKDVVQEQETLDVPVTREEVQISRSTVDRPVGDSEQAFQDGDTIRVPIVEEQVTVTKEPRIVEEIEIQKVAHQDTETVSDSVRREEVYVDEQTDGTTSDPTRR